MNLHGCDVYLWSESTPTPPQTLGRFSLTFISSRGTRIWPPPAPEVEPADWYQCRFMSDTEASDQEIDQVAQSLTGQGFRWTKLQKLYKKDGVNQFSEPY